MRLWPEIIDPPEAVLEHAYDKGDVSDEEWRALERRHLQEEWREIAGLLQQGSTGEQMAAYQGLLKLQERLQERFEGHKEDPTFEWAQKAQYFSSLVFFFERRGEEHGRDEEIRSTQWEGSERLAAAGERSGSGASAKYLEAEIEVPIVYGDDEASESNAYTTVWSFYSEGINVQLAVENDQARNFAKVGITETHAFHPKRAFTLDAGTTWDEAAAYVKEYLDRLNRHRGKRSRTVEWLVFRKRIVEAVLHQYEVFGAVESLSDAEAERITEGNSRYHSRTVSIGKALLKYHRDHGGYPAEAEQGTPFHGNKGNFMNWAAGHIEAKAPSAREALVETGCWPPANTGSSRGLKEILKRTEKYAREHDDNL